MKALLLLACINLTALYPVLGNTNDCYSFAGLVAWWSADGTGRDAVGTNEVVAVNGAHFAAGRVNQGFEFDGTDDYFRAPDSGLWNFGADDFTVELWANFREVRSSSLGRPWAVFVGNDESGGEFRKWVFALGGGVLTFHINGPGIGPRFFVQAPFGPDVDRWYHFATVRSQGTYTLFVDGSPVGSQYDPTPIGDASAPLTIGQAEALGYFPGRLDEVAIYHSALTPAQLQTIFAQGRAGKCPFSLEAAGPNALGRQQVRVTGETGRAYVVQGSVNLSDWLPLSTNTISAGPSFLFADPESHKLSRRFYRGFRLP